ncbi:MAG: segregation/condensation protein A [Chloroflexota bacterium]|nr:segregation/condensation protein A [Chloroflexota bacterium]
MPFYQIKLPVFEGPLDLLLRLIEREELDITAVALAEVTDQYLERLADLEQREVRDLVDFLVVAAKLVLIKSAALLPSSSRPSPEDEAEDVGRDLVRQLKIYSQFKQVAGLLHERERKGLHSYVRLVPLRRLPPEPDLSDVTIQDLISLAQEALDTASGPPVGEVVSPVTVTIEEQIDHIEHELSRREQVSFRTLLSRAASRLEIIVTLLAVLELIKQDRVRVHQETLFGEIFIRKLPDPSSNPDSRDANQAA